MGKKGKDKGASITDGMTPECVGPPSVAPPPSAPPPLGEWLPPPPQACQGDPAHLEG